ncbi:DUF4231 domain-containing protein [Clostridium sp. DSM 100503]|uniref:DUF4231 domain-containing protein n=1 Tax=Clostridium sp. DSM 100503 TaxID=2963282 RepID=UPI002149B517|nr:DUF4231 domain-containing protein [Clostridium sp. DSM 100503]MCR1950021.1 DUF4231 domain-containing protein [Clostridium sp. DSM 100503]
MFNIKFDFGYRGEVCKYEKILDEIVSSNKLKKTSEDIIIYKLAYYIRKGNIGKFLYNFTNVVSIILGGIITILSSQTDSKNIFFITIISVFLTMLTSLMFFMDFKIRWLKYRGIAEEIERLIREFYSNESFTEKEFTNQIEILIELEKESWKDYVVNKDTLHN